MALIINASSRKLGKKDLIKIENKIDLSLDMLGFMDPNITVNIIEDEKIVEKINLSLPKKIQGVIECKNPRCVTSIEKNITHSFILINEEKGTYKCEYCDHLYSREDWDGNAYKKL